MTLPDLPTITTVQERLEKIFPEGTPNRNAITRQIAARTVFVMLYTGAVEGAEGVEPWLAPKHVTRMSDRQVGLQTEQERTAYRIYVTLGSAN